MPATIPTDIERAIKRICSKTEIAFTGLDWKRVYVAMEAGKLTEDEYWALGIFCRENGEYVRDSFGNFVLDEQGRPKWKPGKGDFEQLRYLLEAMHLVESEVAWNGL